MFLLLLLTEYLIDSDALNCIIRTDLPPTTPVTKAAHQPAYLRSFKLPVPKAAIAPKITQALAELGVSHSRLVMHTRDNIIQLESLLEATAALVETKRVVDKVEFDIRVLKARLGMRESQGVEGDGDTPNGGDSMDVDEVNEVSEAVGEDGRAQSVVSTRSARSRKHVRISKPTVHTSKLRHADTQVYVYLFSGYLSVYKSWDKTAEAGLVLVCSAFLLYK